MYNDHSATINWDDGQIRFWPGYRLDDDEYKATKKNGLTWSRGETCFKGAWSPWKQDFLGKQFGIEMLDDDETDLLERAESRSDHYHEWGDNAQKRSTERHETASQIASRFAFGQPILIGHHSEKRARADKERINVNMSKAVEESRKADYWKGRAQRAVAAAERRYKPDTIFRRIETLEARLRGFQRDAESGANEMAGIWIEFLEKRLAYQRALYAESGGIVAEQLVFEVGGAVRCWAGLCEILRVNKKSVTVARDIRPGVTWKERITYDKVKRAFTKDEYQEALAKFEAQNV